MARISRDQMFMMIAKAAALRSTCFRLNVGAVVVDVSTSKPVSLGYNGSPPGAPHCRGNECPGKLYCTETIHAEDNALRGLPDDYGRVVDLFVTHSPCVHCSSLILGSALPIRRVIFETTYRSTDHLDQLAIGCHLQQLTPAGYLIDWKTKNVIETP